MARSRKSSRGIGAKLAAVGLGALVAGGVLEVGLRLMPQAISPRLLVLFEPGLREQLAAGAFPVRSAFRELERDDGGPPLLVAKPATQIVSIDQVPEGSQYDELGFCNPPGSYAERERIDVVTVGDSFTWCHGVGARETWTYLLGSQTGLATYNLGRGGSGLYEYLQVVRAFGLEKRPRVVLLAVYGGNDLRDAVYFKEYREVVRSTGRPPADEHESVWPALTHGPIGRVSYAANLVTAFATRVANRDAEDAERSEIDFRYALQRPSGTVQFNVENRDRDEVLFAQRLMQGSASLELWDEPLMRLSNYARKHGFMAVVTYIPSAHVAYKGRVRFSDPAIGPLVGRLDRAQRTYLEARSPELGFVFHDVTPALQRAAKAADAALLYDPVHIHLTERGHAVVASALAEFLQERGLAAPQTAP